MDRTTDSVTPSTIDHLGQHDDRDDEPQDVTPLDAELDHEMLEEDHDDLHAADLDDDSDLGMSRRVLLRGGVAAGALALGAGSQLLVPGRAEAHGDITVFPGIGGQRTRYEATGNFASFGYRPSFHRRMGNWLEFWNTHTPYSKKIVVWSYGVHTDSRVSEAHNAGRGFDLTRLYPTGTDGKRHLRFSARHDKWKNYGVQAKRRNRRWYWGTAASIHHHFRNVLTYYYNADHDNHIHIDNLESGLHSPSFHSGSRAQVQHVQACCRWIWGKSTTVTGNWNAQTADHTTQVLRRIGRGDGTIVSSKDNWLAFNTATCRKAYGVQAY
ncbi:MAG: hypothetical protein ACRDT8_08795 [Micromonosporaceae bacterium]